MTDTVNYGRTPGYWKNHTENWTFLSPPLSTDGAELPGGITTLSKVEDIFYLPGYSATDDMTLLQALSAGGGGVTALLRQATASFMNAAVDGDVPGIPENNFLLWHSDVTSAVQYVLRDDTPVASEVEKLKNIFQYFNEAEGGQLKLDTNANNPADSFFTDVFDDLAQARDLADDGLDNDTWKAGGDLGDPRQYGWDDFLALTATQQFAIIDNYIL